MKSCFNYVKSVFTILKSVFTIVKAVFTVLKAVFTTIKYVYILNMKSAFAVFCPLMFLFKDEYFWHENSN